MIVILQTTGYKRKMRYRIVAKIGLFEGRKDDSKFK